MNLKLTGPKYDCLVPWYRVGSPLSIDTKIMEIGQRMTSQWRFQTWLESETGLSVKIDQNFKKFIFLLKSSKYQNFTHFFAYKEGKWCFLHVLKVLAPYHADIFQNGDLKYFEVATTPLPSNFDGSPYPHLKGYPRFFFIKMTAKDVKEMS